MSEFFLLFPFLVIIIGILYLHFRKLQWIPPAITALAIALFPIIFWLIRNMGPFYGGADIGAGLLVLFFSFFGTFVSVILFARQIPKSNTLALKIAAGIVVVSLLFSGIYHMLLLKQHKDYLKKSEIDCQKLPYHCAVKENKISQIKILKDSGFDIEAKDGFGRTALFYAFYSQTKMEYLTELLNQGANVNQIDESGYPVFYYILLSNPFDTKLANVILDHGFNVNSGFGQGKKMTLLNVAIIHKNNPVVDYLLSNGADPFKKDEYGYNACERLKVHSIQGLSQLEKICGAH